MNPESGGECCINVRRAGPLEGEVVVPGAKNSVLKLMAASLMADGVFEITNVRVAASFISTEPNETLPEPCGTSRPASVI